MLVANVEFKRVESPVAELADDGLATMRGLVNGVVLSVACWAGIFMVAILLF